MVSAVTATTISANVRQNLYEAVGRILDSIGCENVLDSALPPITTYEQLIEILRVDEGFDQHKLEVWFISRDRFQHDPLRRGTFTRYDQIHSVEIIGLAWRENFRESYEYIQDQGEELSRTLEKNKKLGSTQTNPSIQEIANLETSYGWGPQTSGEVYMYRVSTKFDVLVGLEEAGGRV